MWGGTVEWGDYDNDNDLDLLLSGYTGYLNDSANTSLYNNNNGMLTEQTEIALANARESASAWGDYDNDGLRDILHTGNIGDWNLKTLESAIYKNNGNNSFTKQGIELEGVCDGSVAWGDYDNDGDLDILLIGNIRTTYGEKKPFFKLYKNEEATPNIPPSVINNLHETINGNEVTFSWDAAFDADQNGGLNYNLYVYNTDLNTYAKSAHAFRQSESLNGKRLIARNGDIQGTSYKLILPKGNYTWNVQAIDANYAGGSFANERSFTVEKTLSVEKSISKNFSIFPNPANDFVVIDFGNTIFSKISLIDIRGKVLLQKTELSNKELVDISNLAKGIYFLKIQTTNMVHTEMIIKD
jgi:hypothetical protein